MHRTIRTTIIVAIAFVTMLAMAGVAGAFPSQGGSCTNCHTTAGGSLTYTPSPLNILLGANGLLTFQNINTGGADSSAIAVQVPASLYSYLTAGAGGNAWTKRSNANGNSFVSSTFTAAPSSYVLDLMVGSGAPAGNYTLDFYIAGSGPVGTKYSSYAFNVSAVPEPAVLGLLAVGVAVTVLCRSRRQ